jgi:hypothetical protein
MLKFPDHYGDARLDHNDHLSVYDTVAQTIEHDRFKTYADYRWVSLEEKQKAIETNELWSFWWKEAADSEYSKRHASTLEALWESFGLESGEVKFPPHKASLHINHNEHLVNFETVAEQLESQPEYYSDEDWVTPEDKETALADNELWTIHWYPDTPVGFCLAHATSLESLLQNFVEDASVS